MPTQGPRGVNPPTRLAEARLPMMVEGQPPDVQARVWSNVTEAWLPLRDADGRVRTENEAIWVVGTK